MFVPGEVLELAEQSGRFRIHFATAREAFNMVMAAVDGHAGDPGSYRDYHLHQIMSEPSLVGASTEQGSVTVLR